MKSLNFCIKKYTCSYNVYKKRLTVKSCIYKFSNILNYLYKHSMQYIYWHTHEHWNSIKNWTQIFTHVFICNWICFFNSDIQSWQNFNIDFVTILTFLNYMLARKIKKYPTFLKVCKISQILSFELQKIEYIPIPVCNTLPMIQFWDFFNENNKNLRP